MGTTGVKASPRAFTSGGLAISLALMREGMRRHRPQSGTSGGIRRSRSMASTDRGFHRSQRRETRCEGAMATQSL